MAGEPCFTLVCLRRLEDDPVPSGVGVEDIAVSHDRRLLAVLDADGRCRCHSCDHARQAFALPPCVEEEVKQIVWLHLPTEKWVRLHQDALNEYPGSPCLVALDRDSSALILCLCFPIEGPDVLVSDKEARIATCGIQLDHGAPMFRWAQDLPQTLPPNQIWRYQLPLASIITLFPDIADLTAIGGSAGAPGQLRVRLCVARPASLMMFFNDSVALLLGFGWQGVTAESCFFLQRLPSEPEAPGPPPIAFSDIVACQDWIFAVTPPPLVYLLMWHMSGVAFHAIPLGEYLPEDVYFVSLVVALDLLGVSLCDNRHNVWIVSLDQYFDSGLKGLDWDMVREKQRCARDVGVLGKTGKAYQELSVFPEAFGLHATGGPACTAGGRRKPASTTVMDCLVEGVPTYGIPLPSGAFGVGDQFFGADLAASDAPPGDAEAAGAAAGLVADANFTRCIPFAWHERIYQSQEWLDLDRPWAISRGDGLCDPNFTLEGAGGCAASVKPSQQLNGFSIPAQNKLGDDDLHYSLYAALHKHARRQFKSRLPPWITKTRIPRKPSRIMPPMVSPSPPGRGSGSSGVMSSSSPMAPGRRSSAGDSASELDSGSEDGSVAEADAVGTASVDSPTDLAVLRQRLSAAIGGQGAFGAGDGPRGALAAGRRRAKIERLKLFMTASHVFCEIWEEGVGAGSRSDCPWGLFVAPRPSRSQGGVSSPAWQVDHLTGSLLQNLKESPHPSSPQQQGIVFRSRRRWRSLLTQNHIWYMLSEGGSLHALLLNQSPVRIISNLLIFESRAKASRLCALNGWDPKQLPALTLFLGLRFRQLEEIRQSLAVLKPDQEMEACQMIMDFIVAGYSCVSLVLPFSPSPSAPLALSSRVGATGPRSTSCEGADPGVVSSPPPADRSFVSRLLEIAMQYVIKLIQTRVAQIQDCEGACRAITYLQPTHAAPEPLKFSAMVHELSQLTVHLQSLRAYQHQLIKALSDEKSWYDAGIRISCPAKPDAFEQGRVGGLKPGLRGADDDAALAATLQAQGSNAASTIDRVAHLGTESTEAIVRGALISGKVSSALNLFHELAEAEGREGSSEGVFQEFRVTAGRLAYQLVCNQQLDFLFVAMHILRNVGESVNRFFKAVAFHTSKRLVRRRLLRHLDHTRRLTQDEQFLISLVNLLEQLYTNPCYTTEFNRMTTRLTTGQYPQRAHVTAAPPFFTWPAGGRSMLLVGDSVDGAMGGHITRESGQDGLSSWFEQQTSLRELPMAQRIPLELYDMWVGYQTPVMAAMLEMPVEARKAWANLPCGDIDDLDARPLLGLSNFHQSSNLEKDQDISIADLRDRESGGEGDGDMVSQARGTGAWTTCRRCHLDGPKDEDIPKGAAGELGRELSVGDDTDSNYTMGYLHVTLSWMKCWSWSTRARIVMEKTHFRPHLVQSLRWLDPPPSEGPADKAWSRCWLDFLVAHQDWRGLAAWAQSLPLRLSDRADDQGRHCVDLTHLEYRGLPYCTSYAKEVMLQQLGRRGIFCQGDVQSFSALLRRLAQSGRLLGGGGKVELGEISRGAGEGAGDARDRDAQEEAALPDEGVLPLDRLLPVRGVSPFHRFFLHWCIDKDLPMVTLLYLQRYELGTTMEDLKGLELRHAHTPWASVLLVGRLGNAHLFASSLQHAAAVYGGGAEAPDGRCGSIRYDAEKAAYMPLNDIARRSPTAFLATLMFAPVASALDAVAAPVGVPWSVGLDVFKRVVQEHPTLHDVFFPPDGTALRSLEREEAPGGAGAPPAPSFNLSESLVEHVAQTSRERWSRTGAPAAAVGQAGGTASSAVDPCGRSSNASWCTDEQAPQRMSDDMTTFKEDATLSNLLSDVASFDVRRALKRLPVFGFAVEDNKAREKAAASLADLVAPEERFHDDLEEGYYLAQGRAMMAFHVLMTKCARRMDEPGELKFPLVLSAEDAKRLHMVAKSVAFHNLLNEGVVSSAVCLLELCSLETEMLRVDVQAARRIYEHHMQPGQGLGPEDGDRTRAAAASVIELFLSFPDVQASPSRAAEAAINSGHLLTALRMLEESTWALDPHPSAPSVSSLQALAYDSPWHLVALFCRVHSLPRSLTLLHELARNNDWVMFLHESDLQQCPADTVLDVVDGYFTDAPLQSHLRILAHTIAAQEEDPAMKASSQHSPSKVKSEPEVRQAGDAIGVLERCREKVGTSTAYNTGSGLLHQALVKRMARLAVVASAFKDVSALQCMAVWLSVNTERSEGNPSPEAAALLATSPLRQPTPGEVAGQIADLCRKSQAFALVLRALKIFDPTSPLVDFVKFHRAFVQSRFQCCREHLRRFVQRRTAESQEPFAKREPCCLELVPYVTQLSEDMVQYLLDGFPRARMMLLSALHQANFSPHYSHLFRAFRLIKQTGLDVDFRMPPGELLQLLISRKMFAEAREWACSSGIVSDSIVFEEVTGMIVDFRQGVWWNVLDERLQLWHKCYNAFLQQSYPPLGAALFFLDITSKLEPDLFAREQLMLLCIAAELLGATSEEAAGGAVPDRARGRLPQTPGREQLGRIKLSMLLILTGTNQDLAAELDFSPLDLSYGTLRSLVHRIPEGVIALPLYHNADGVAGAAAAVPRWDGNSAAGAPPSSAAAAIVPEKRGPKQELIPYLETAVSSLINCDELGWARQLARGFDFESADLHLAGALESIAVGQAEEPLGDLLARSVLPPLDPATAAAAAVGDREKVLQGLIALCSRRISLFCRRRVVFSAVARSIGLACSEVYQIDVGLLLDRLLSPQPNMSDVALCRSLLSCYPRPLNMSALSEVLANRFVLATTGPGARDWSEEELDEFVSLLGASPGKLGDAALSRIPNFFRKGGGAQGRHEGEMPFECEVKVIIMAYHAYVQACSETSIGELLCNLEDRAQIYVREGRFQLLVQLLAAIPEYHAMEYMFGHLLQHGRLELLLGLARKAAGAGGPQQVLASSPMPKSGLAIALVRYLQHHFPRNLELLVQVHLCFGMESQLASLLESKAWKVAHTLGRKWERICSEDGEEQLLMCLTLFLQASKFFFRAKRYQKHLIANEFAALICVQLKAVQIHLAASLQDHQNAVPRPGTAKDENLLAMPELDGLGPHLFGLPPGGSWAQGVLAKLEVEFDTSAARTAQSDDLAGHEELPLGGGSALSQSPEAAAPPSSPPSAASGAPLPSAAGNGGPGAAAAEAENLPDAPPVAPGRAQAPALTLGPAGDPFVVINLEAVEVEVFVEYHQDFVVAFQVVSAYRHLHDRNIIRVWPRALYRQVVLHGNFAYLRMFMRHLPLTREYVDAILRLYLGEACQEQYPQRASRMKVLLREGVPNLETRFQLARQLGTEFTDVQSETASLVYMA